MLTNSNAPDFLGFKFGQETKNPNTLKLALKKRVVKTAQEAVLNVKSRKKLYRKMEGGKLGRLTPFLFRLNNLWAKQFLTVV